MRSSNLHPQPPPRSAPSAVARTVGSYSLVDPYAGRAARHAAHRLEVTALQFRERNRGVVIEEHDARERLVFEWSVSADRLVRDGRKLAASALLMPALGFVETRESSERSLTAREESGYWEELCDLAFAQRHAVSGSFALERFLVNWVHRRRALAERFSRARQRLRAREQQLRSDLWREWCSAAFSTVAVFLAAQEERRRLALERWHLTTAVGTCVTSLALHEAAARNAIVARSTSSDIQLAQLLARGMLAGNERRVRIANFAGMRTAADSIMVEEDHWRIRIGGEADEAHRSLLRLIGRLSHLAWRRDLEGEELLRRATLYSETAGRIQRDHDRVRSMHAAESQVQISRIWRGRQGRRAVWRRAFLQRLAWVEAEEHDDRAAVELESLAPCLGWVCSMEEAAREECVWSTCVGLAYVLGCEEGDARARVGALHKLELLEATQRFDFAVSETRRREAIVGVAAEDLERELPKLEALNRYSLRTAEGASFHALMHAEPEHKVLAARTVAQRRAFAAWVDAIANPMLQLTQQMEEAARRRFVREAAASSTNVEKAHFAVEEQCRRSAVGSDESAARTAIEQKARSSADPAVFTRRVLARIRNELALLHRAEVQDRCDIREEESVAWQLFVATIVY